MYSGKESQEQHELLFIQAVACMYLKIYFLEAPISAPRKQGSNECFLSQVPWGSLGPRPGSLGCALGGSAYELMSEILS